MKLVGANAETQVFGQDELPGKSNYFRGNDPTKWRSSVPQYARVRYTNVYPGMDLAYYGNQRELEYDFVLRPGADPGQIRLRIEGAKKLRLEHGDLVLRRPEGEVLLRHPHIYQDSNGKQREIHGHYVINNKSEVGFRVASYDRARTLVIDPVLAYSTYVGGSKEESGASIAVDSAGNAYITGQDRGSTDFPAENPIQSTYGGGFTDAFVTKINADGSAAVYSTYLGGSQNDTGEGIAVDSAGNAYLTGQTDSNDFPLVNAIHAVPSGHSTGFVTKINAAGSALVYSTYLGGSGDDVGTGIAVDSAGKVYLTGVTTSINFPTVNAIQPTLHSPYGNAFVTKINAGGTALVYSTYLGGSSSEDGEGIAVDPGGNVYVAGGTTSADFPIVNAIQPVLNGFGDAFVTKINPAGSALLYSTYLGGSNGEGARGIASDSAGNAYVTGITESPDFPTLNAIQPAYAGNRDLFVTSINAAGTAFIYSTYLGANKDDEANAIALDSAGSAYVVGASLSGSFPKTLSFQKRSLAFQPAMKGKGDAIVTKIALRTFVKASPKNLAFQTEAIGTTSPPLRVTLTNTGTSPLTINKIYVAGVNAADFAKTDTRGATVAAGASCAISVTFTPSAASKRKGTLGISDSDPASPQAIALVGTGT